MKNTVFQLTEFFFETLHNVKHRNSNSKLSLHRLPETPELRNSLLPEIKSAGLPERIKSAGLPGKITTAIIATTHCVEGLLAFYTTHCLRRSYGTVATG